MIIYFGKNYFEIYKGIKLDERISSLNSLIIIVFRVGREIFIITLKSVIIFIVTIQREALL